MSLVSWVIRSTATPITAMEPTISHLYLPVRDTMRPDTMELKIRPTMSGRAARPELVGEKPSTTWNQRGRNTIAPKNAKAAKKTETIVAE